MNLSGEGGNALVRHIFTHESDLFDTGGTWHIAAKPRRMPSLATFSRGSRRTQMLVRRRANAPIASHLSRAKRASMLDGMKHLERITFDPEQCGGRPCIRGMRIRVKDVLEMLAGGASEAQILEDFPDLEIDDIRACLAFAAAQANHAVLQSAA
jgi:uncharacterized protein (DUF433 family)